MKKATILAGMLSCAMISVAQDVAGTDSLYGKTQELDEVTITNQYTTKRMIGAVNGMQISQQEMFRAACCNLGESFSTNPSVDVSYNDAATGARQIKLLGLSGTYVQMLTETMPNFRGAAIPYALGYVPGTWMKSISVSKGCASVKNGYESITGQIDIEYLKPDDEVKTNINLYGDIQNRFEANADRNFHLSDKLSTNVLLHYEKRAKEHDGNHDGFMDMPKIEQFNIGNRWKLVTPNYIMHAGWSAIHENRISGQAHGGKYRIGIDTERYEAYMKHAFILNKEKQTNIAFLANGSVIKQDAYYGSKDWRQVKFDEKTLNAQLMYETSFDCNHSLSTGVSFNHDYMDQQHNWCEGLPKAENVIGGYAQYTYTLGTKLTAMAGIRLDNSSLFGTFMTPRAHIKFQPWDVMSIRLSAGKGFRTHRPIEENSYVLASGKTPLLLNGIIQEEAWNYGISTALNIPVGEKMLKVNAEYYYTNFLNQGVMDYETEPQHIIFHELRGKSYSHVVQVDASYELLQGLDITAAYRYNNVKCSYLVGNDLYDATPVLMTKPLTSKYKALLTTSYKDELELWQFDVTLQLNGGGRLPAQYGTYKAFEQLSAQLTRHFRYFDLYVGGENLTNYKQKNPIIGAEDPWSNAFEPTLIYGPIDGAMGYAGIRIKL